MSPAKPILETQEIGSLSKPLWRIKALSKDKGLEAKEIDEAIELGRRMGVEDVGRLGRLLRTSSPTKEDREAIKRFSSLYALRFEEWIGLDWVYDGEQLRTEMYDEPMRHIENVEPRGWVRSFDNRYYVKQAIVGPPRSRKPYHIEEFAQLKKVAKRGLKIPITGAYTLLDWSYDEHLAARDRKDLFGATGRARRTSARRELGLELARDVLRPNIKALVEAGAKRIQIDEPAAATVPEEVPLVVELFNESTKGLTGDFSIHICFSDYRTFFPHILELKNCTEFALEFANGDRWERGTTDDDRPGYTSLKLFADHKAPFRIGLGVCDIHTDRIEPLDLVRDRIEYAVRTLGDPTKVAVNPDCGLRTRSWEVAEAKLRVVVEGARALRVVHGGAGPVKDVLAGSRGRT